MENDIGTHEQGDQAFSVAVIQYSVISEILYVCKKVGKGTKAGKVKRQDL